MLTYLKPTILKTKTRQRILCDIVVFERTHNLAKIGCDDVPLEEILLPTLIHFFHGQNVPLLCKVFWSMTPTIDKILLTTDYPCVKRVWRIANLYWNENLDFFTNVRCVTTPPHHMNLLRHSRLQGLLHVHHLHRIWRLCTRSPKQTEHNMCNLQFARHFG